jgi:hypothetical protein
MRLRGWVLGAVVLTVVLAAGSVAASSTCMRFLKISTLPRIAGMGEASVAVSDATWAEVNPAHLTAIDGSLITFAHTAWFHDISLETLTFGTSSAKHGFGLSLIGLSTDPLEGYDAFDIKQGTFRYYDLVVSGTYARRLPGNLSVGASGKVLYEKIDWDAATGFGLDLGIGYVPPGPLLGGELALGLAVRDLGPKMGYFDEEFDLPLTLQGGLSYRPAWLPNDVSATLAVDYQKTRDEDGGLLFGVEVGLKHMVAVRFGHRGPAEEGNIAYGVGLNVASAVIDYAYVDMGDHLGDIHRVGLAFKLGGVFPAPERSN